MAHDEAAYLGRPNRSTDLTNALRSQIPGNRAAWSVRCVYTEGVAELVAAKRRTDETDAVVLKTRGIGLVWYRDNEEGTRKLSAKERCG